MKKFLINRTREDGFTLIELLVVVIIIAILAAIAVPVYIGIQNNAKKSSIQSDVATTKLNVAAALTEDGSVSSGTYSSAAKDGDAQIQNSGVNGDEVVTVVVNPDNSYTVSAKSTKLNYTASADSTSGQQTGTTGPTAQDLVTIPSAWKADTGNTSLMTFLLVGDSTSSSTSVGNSGLNTISSLAIYNNVAPGTTTGTTYFTLDGIYDANGNSLATLMHNADGNVASYFTYTGDSSAGYRIIVRLQISGSSYSQAAADSVAKVVFDDGNGHTYTVTKQ